MTNQGEHIKLPRAWVFPALNILVSILIGAGVLWIRNDIRKELANYVTVKEFESYQKTHKEWGDEVMKRLQMTTEENSQRLTRIEAKVDRLAEKK